MNINPDNFHIELQPVVQPPEGEERLEFEEQPQQQPQFQEDTTRYDTNTLFGKAGSIRAQVMRDNQINKDQLEVQYRINGIVYTYQDTVGKDRLGVEVEIVVINKLTKAELGSGDLKVPTIYTNPEMAVREVEDFCKLTQMDINDQLIGKTQQIMANCRVTGSISIQYEDAESLTDRKIVSINHKMLEWSENDTARRMDLEKTFIPHKDIKEGHHPEFSVRKVPHSPIVMREHVELYEATKLPPERLLGRTDLKEVLKYSRKMSNERFQQIQGLKNKFMVGNDLHPKLKEALGNHKNQSLKGKIEQEYSLAVQKHNGKLESIKELETFNEKETLSEEDFNIINQHQGFNEYLIRDDIKQKTQGLDTTDEKKFNETMQILIDDYCTEVKDTENSKLQAAQQKKDNGLSQLQLGESDVEKKFTQAKVNRDNAEKENRRIEELGLIVDNIIKNIPPSAGDLEKIKADPKIFEIMKKPKYKKKDLQDLMANKKTTNAQDLMQANQNYNKAFRDLSDERSRFIGDLQQLGGIYNGILDRALWLDDLKSKASEEQMAEITNAVTDNDEKLQQIEVLTDQLSSIDRNWIKIGERPVVEQPIVRERPPIVEKKEPRILQDTNILQDVRQEQNEEILDSDFEDETIVKPKGVWTVEDSAQVCKTIKDSLYEFSNSKWNELDGDIEKLESIQPRTEEISNQIKEKSVLRTRYSGLNDIANTEGSIAHDQNHDHDLHITDMNSFKDKLQAFCDDVANQPIDKEIAQCLTDLKEHITAFGPKQK